MNLFKESIIMPDELIISKPGDLVKTSKYATTDVVESMQTSTEYLPYIQLMGSMAGLVKQGKFPIGHFACFKGKDPVDLGDKFDGVVLGLRPKAMEFGDDVISVYNPENPEFKRIQAAASNKQQGFVFGLEFLLYMPDFDEVACYLFGNASHQREAPNVVALFDEQNAINEYVLIEFEAFLIPENKKKQSWHVPRISKSENTLSRMVSGEKLEAVQASFNNPTESYVETVEEDTRDV